MPLPTEKQLEVLQKLKEMVDAVSEHFPASRNLNSSIQEAVTETESEIVDSVSPQSITDVRPLPVCLWRYGVEYVLGTADETVESDSPDAFCTDWWDDKLTAIPDVAIEQMVIAGRIQNPKQLMAWIERRAPRAA